MHKDAGYERIQQVKEACAKTEPLRRQRCVLILLYTAQGTEACANNCYIWRRLQRPARTQSYSGDRPEEAARIHLGDSGSGLMREAFANTEPEWTLYSRRPRSSGDRCARILLYIVKHVSR